MNCMCDNKSFKQTSEEVDKKCDCTTLIIVVVVLSLTVSGQLGYLAWYFH